LETLELVEKYGVTQLHAFPFSAHVDHYSVPAGKFPDQVPNHIIQRRLKTLLEAGKNAQRAFAEKHIGKELRVLVERCA
jgi:tRNA A37 methylthiotransferase MiaB